MAKSRLEHADTTILEQSPRSKIGRLMGVGSLVITVAPAIGPTVGGAEYPCQLFGGLANGLRSLYPEKSVGLFFECSGLERFREL